MISKAMRRVERSTKALRRGKEILELILNLNREHGTTLIIVTHDPRIGEQAHRVISLCDGLLCND